MAEPDAPAYDVPSLAAALRTDPVNVQPLAGNRQTAEIDAALTEIVENSPHPIHIVLASG